MTNPHQPVMTASASSLRRLSALAFLLWYAALPAMAAPAWLIAPPEGTAQAGEPIQPDVFKPAAQGDWPETIRLSLARDDSTRDVTLADVGPVVPGYARRTYHGVMPANLTGLVRAELAGAGTPAPQPEGRNKLLFPANEPTLSDNETMYFVIGSGTTASFQFSFKYRPIRSGQPPRRVVTSSDRAASGLYADLALEYGADSAPFRDTSYRPRLFWQGARLGEGLMPDFLRGGKRG